MERRQWAALLGAACLCLALCGCRNRDTQGDIFDGYNSLEMTQEPAPPEKTPRQVLEEQLFDDAHDAFLVDTGGSRGTLLVTAALVGESQTEPGSYLIRLRVWDQAKAAAPLQIIELESPIFLGVQVADVDFDGSEDITILYYRGVSTEGYYCWRWDETLEQFVEEPEYAQISSPQIDAETQTISGWNRNSVFGDGTSTFHQWVDGELVCVRRIEVYQHGDFKSPWLLTVEDWVDGKLAEVFRAEFSVETGDFFEERTKWEDLSYHGEES